MIFPDDIQDAEKTAAAPTSVPNPCPAESFAVIESREEATFRREQRGWAAPAIVCLLLTAGSFHYYQQKVIEESRIELKVIRADASLRKAHLANLQEGTRFQEQQLATSHAEDGAIAPLEE